MKNWIIGCSKKRKSRKGRGRKKRGRKLRRSSSKRRFSKRRFGSKRRFSKRRFSKRRFGSKRRFSKKNRTKKRFGRMPNTRNIMGNYRPSSYMNTFQGYTGEGDGQRIRHLDNVPKNLRANFYV